MKIGEVKVGEEYGALDDDRYHGKLPRQVRVEEIVVEEQQTWSRDPWSRQRRGSRNVRRLKIKMLDAARESPSGGYSYKNAIMSAPKDAIIVVDAKQLVAPWKDIRSDVLQKIEDEQTKTQAEAALLARVVALLPNKLKAHDANYRIDVMVYRRGNGHRVVLQGLKLEDDVLEHVLALAEKGAKVAS